MITHNYICEDGHVTELRARYDNRPDFIDCPVCHKKAKWRFPRPNMNMAFINADIMDGDMAAKRAGWDD